MGTDLYKSPSGYRIQKTLKQTARFKGVGLHTGVQTEIHICPAEPNHGIVFVKASDRKPARVYAHYDAVVSTRMATSLGFAEDPSVRIHTVEHILAALYGIGITNAEVRVFGSEIPILDGSAQPYFEGLLDAGLSVQPYSTPRIKVLKPIKVYQNDAICELLPRDSLRLTTSINFPHPKIGAQIFALELSPEAFQRQVCSARTFGFLTDLESLQSHNLAQGASLSNVLAFSQEGILNPEGLRFDDECVRHKLLDAIGDLALCSSWIEGELVSYRGGHSIHLALMKSLRFHKSRWKFMPAEPLTGRPQSEQPVELISAHLA